MRERDPIETEWGEDGRLTRLARTGMLDWKRSAAGAGAEGTARKTGAGAPTEESGAEAAKKSESLRPLSPLAANFMYSRVL